MTKHFTKKYLRTRFLEVIFICVLLIFSNAMLAQAGVWTWMNGSDTVGYAGNYGVKGVSSTDNEPPGRYQAAHWKDKDGNFWMYGGVNFENLAIYNDLWKFDPQTAEWTWMHGPDTPDNPAVYGEKGIPSALNLPPAVAWGALCWYDGDDGLYLYGGGILLGISTNLWKYSISLNQWTWLTGSEIVAEPEVSGIKGIPSIDNNPGLRSENETCWTYENKLWFTCGQNENFISSATWNFDLDIMQWTWVHGPLAVANIPVKGVQGVFDVSNYPNSRLAWSKFNNEESAYLLAGGESNDLWHFNADSMAWRFMGEGNGFPFWEEYCDFNSDNIPGTYLEFQSAGVVDECKEVLWVFGGQNAQEMWAYDIRAESWVLAWGTPELVIDPFHGIKGVPSEDNIIDSRFGACMWSDDQANLWVYGGIGHTGSRSDIWRFEPDYSCLNLSDTSECCELTVSFRISHTADSSGSVEIQVVDGEGDIEYSIDGGMTWHADNFFEDLPPGDYEIVVRDENGCFYTGSITILDISVAVKNHIEAEISTDPNPTSDMLFISIDQVSAIAVNAAQIQLIDSQGKNCIKATAHIENGSVKTKISLVGLPSGNYFLRVQIDNSYLLKKITKI